MEPLRPRVRVKHPKRPRAPAEDAAPGEGPPDERRRDEMLGSRYPPGTSPECDKYRASLRVQKCGRCLLRSERKCAGECVSHGQTISVNFPLARWFFAAARNYKTRRQGVGMIMLVFSMLMFSAAATAQAKTAEAPGSPRHETAYACEGKTLNIECRDGEEIHLIRANYGRFSITICNDHGNTDWSVNCMSNKSLRVLHERCTKKQNCSILASTSLFGDDPCSNTLKYLEAHYQCTPATSSSRTARPLASWFVTSQPSVWRSTVPTSIGVAVSAGGSNGAASGGTSVEKSRPSSGVHHVAPPTFSPQITMPPDLKPGIIKVKNDGHSPEIEKVPSKIPSDTLNPTVEEKTNVPDRTPAEDISKTGHSNGRPVFPSNTDRNNHGVTENPKTIDNLGIHVDIDRNKNIPLDIPPHDREHTVTDAYGNKRHHHRNHHEPSGPGVTVQPLRHHCSPQAARGLQWNWTSVDDVAVQPCPGGATGLARWRCISSSHRLSHYQQQKRLGVPNKDALSPQSRMPVVVESYSPDALTDDQPVWISENPDLSECRSVWLNNLEMRVNEGDALLSIINDLSQVTSSKTLYGGDMMTTTNIIKRLAHKMSADIQGFPDTGQREAFVTELLLGVIRTGSNLLDVTQQASWKDLGHPAQMSVVTSLLTGLEDNAFLLAGAIHRQKIILQTTKNILLSVRVLETRNVETEEFPAREKERWSASQDVIYLPRGALIDNSEGGLVRIVFVAFDRLEEILQPPSASAFPLTIQNPLDDSYQPESLPLVNHQQLSTRKERDNISRIINSKVISASLGKGRHIQLSQPVRMTLHHLRTENVTNPTCVFWDYTENVWSPEGCQVEWTNLTHTGCQCTHLTIFAILMDVHSVPLSPANAIALNIITLVGCSISVIALIASIIMFQCIGGMKSDRITIHKNLCFCLLIAELIFMFGIELTANRIICGVIAALLHYFFLAAFAWMFLEGFQLYAMLVEVFEPERARGRWYYFFGYLIPLAIVGISGLVDAKSYGTSQHCWLRTDNYFHLSFIGPAALVILANWFILSLVIYMMCRHSNVSIKTKENNKLYKIRVWLRSSMVLAVLLGLTWTFGLLYINQETVIMAFIFTILNSLQGVFIFVSHCLQNEMFQKECSRLGRRHQWLSCCVHLAPAVPPGPAPATASSSAPGSTQQCPPTAAPIPAHTGKHQRYHRDHAEDQCLEDVSERDHPTRYTLKQQQQQESPRSWNNTTMVRPSAPPLPTEIDNTSAPHSLSMPSIHNNGHSAQHLSHNKIQNHNYQQNQTNRVGTPIPGELQNEYPNIDFDRSRSPSCFSVKMASGVGNGDQNNGWGVVQNPLSSGAVSGSWKNTSSKHQQHQLVGSLQHPDHPRRIDPMRTCPRYDHETLRSAHIQHGARHHHSNPHSHPYTDTTHYFRGTNQEYRTREEPEYEEIDRNETLMSDMSDDNSGHGDRCIHHPDLGLQGGSYNLHGDSRPLISYSPGESHRYDHSPVALDHQIPHGRYNINRWDSLDRHPERGGYGYHSREQCNPRTLAAVLNRENNVVCHVEPHPVTEALYPGHGHLQRTVLPPYSDC